MAKKRLNQLRVKGPTTDAVKKSVTEELNRQQKDKTKQSLALARINQKRQTGEDLGILPQEQRALKSPVEDQIEPVCNFRFHPLPIVL